MSSNTKLFLFANNRALIAIRGADSRVILCQDDFSFDELAEFQSGTSRSCWPLVVLQDSGCSCEMLAHHDFSTVADGVQAIFSQYTSYDMGVVQKWEIAATGRGDKIELAVGLVIENFDDIPARAQAHYPNGRDGPPLTVTLPLWEFVDAYDRALQYVRGEEDEEDGDG